MCSGKERGERPKIGRDVFPPTLTALGSRWACPRLSGRGVTVQHCWEEPGTAKRKLGFVVTQTCV